MNSYSQQSNGFVCLGFGQVILSRLEEAFGAPVLEAYAMTEATHLMSSNPLPEEGPHKPGSVGKPVGQEMAILNEKGEIQEPNSKGEVCIRGPNVTKGYKNNPDANKAGFEFGWFHTGDIGYFDSDGYLHLVGRIKELINRGGEFHLLYVTALLFHKTTSLCQAV